MSLCRNRNPYDEDPINGSNNLPKKGVEDIRTNPINLAQGSLRRTKKNKTRMPKDFVFTEEEEQILDKFRQKEKESNSLNFHGDSDDEKLKDEKNANAQNEEEKEKEKIEEIINTDMPKKDENDNKIDNDNKDEENEEKKEEIKNINNEENEEDQKNEKEDEIIDDKNEIKEEHVEKQENENNKEEKKENENKDEEKEEERQEEKEKEKEEEEIKEKENNIEEIQQENEKEIDKKNEIKEEHIEKEEEKNEFMDKNQEEEENKEREEEKNEKDEKEEIKPVEEKIDIANNEEKIETENRVNLRSRPIKKEEQIQKEEKEKIEKEKEEKVEEDEEEEEEDDDEEAKNIKQKEEQKDSAQESEIKDLSKYDSLIKIININLEGLGYSKTDIIKEIDELFNSFSDQINLDDLTSKLSEQLIKKMEITVDSDKTEINNFIKDLVNFYSGDKDKIYGQIMNYIETIEEQSKLNTRTLNRAIRSNIQDCKDRLKERLKEEDIPSDKIISLEKFEKLVEETGLQMKDIHMTVLLYQMKKAVPKGRNFNTLNAIVIVDFLK